MAIEKWLAITSVGLFAMFAGEMISVYNFMNTIPEDAVVAQGFSPDPKLIAHNIKDLIGKESIDFHDLTFKFPNENRQLYLEVLESLIDNKEILKTESNQLILPS